MKKTYASYFHDRRRFVCYDESSAPVVAGTTTETEVTDTNALVDDDGSAEPQAPDASQSTRDLVKAVRAKRTAEESATRKPQSVTKDEGGAEKAAAKEGGDDTPKPYTDDEMASMDLRNADIARVPAYARETVRKLQASETRKHRSLSAKEQELDDLIAKAKTVTEPKREEQPTEEEEDLAFSKEELRQIFKSKAGRQLITEALGDIGLDLEQSRELADQRFMQSALADATSECPEIADPKVLDDVTAEIQASPRWKKLIAESQDKAVISAIFQAAYGKVAARTAAAERESTAAEKKALADEKLKIKNAKELANTRRGSHAAGTQRKAAPPTGAPLSTLEYIRQQRNR